jgi:hypothetical protein
LLYTQTMDPVPPQDPNSLEWEKVTAKSSKKVPLGIAGIALIILLIAGGIYLYRNGYSIQVGDSNPISKTDPLAPDGNSPEVGLPKGGAITMDCNIKKEQNPLVRKVVDVMPKLREVSFQGHVTVVSADEAKKTTNVSLISLSGGQTVQLPFESAEKVYLGNTETKLSELKAGDELVIFYNCNPQIKNDSLKLSRLTKLLE